MKSKNSTFQTATSKKLGKLNDLPSLNIIKKKETHFERQRKRMQTMDYFHRTPSVYNKKQGNFNKMQRTTNLIRKPKKCSLSFENYDQNPIQNFINDEILNNPKKGIARRKSCHCSKCGSNTGYEIKTIAIIGKVRKALIEKQNQVVSSTNELLSYSHSNKFRNRTPTIDSKISLKILKFSFFSKFLK